MHRLRVLIFTCLVGLFLLASSVSLAATDGTISGRVANSLGIGIAGVSVTAYNAANYSYYGVTTLSDGSYTIVGLPTGSYKLDFDAYTTGYISQYYNNKSSSELADAIAVTAGAATSGINATLVLGATITGRVTNSSGTGIADVSVSASDAAGGSGYGYATTQSDGGYTIMGLLAGSYKLQFYGGATGYISQYYNNKTSSALADAIAVTAGAATSGINVTLVLGGSISGTVIDSSGGAISGLSILIYDVYGNLISGASTDASGKYTAEHLPTGNYTIRFDGCYKGYVNKIYDNAVYPDATLVPVTAPITTTGINATLTLGGSISGTVTNNAGVPLSNIYIPIYDTNSGFISEARTDTSGNYKALGIPAGSFKIAFLDTMSKYAIRWYGGKGDFNAATPVTVASITDTTGINAQLGIGVAIYYPGGQKSFGNVLLGSATDYRNFTINNYGTADLVIGTVSLSGTNSAEFSIAYDTCSGKTIQPLGYCTFRLNFSPGSAGVKNAVINIPSNDLNIPTLLISATGTGFSMSVLKGDMNGDGVVTMADAIIALQTMAGMRSQGLTSDYPTSGADVNGDGKVGMPEVIYILQKVAGMR
jgi:hypothetical protein